MPNHALVLRPRPQISNGIERMLSGLLASLGAVLTILTAVTILGHCSWLVERSDSMAPTLRAGDLLAVSRIDPAGARPGDVVTFKEPSRPGMLLTHRVLSVHRNGDEFSFTTKGDANTGTETWSVKSDGTIGRMVIRLPGAGRAVVLLGRPQMRFLLITVASLLLAFELLRRIWGGAKEER